MGVPGSTAKKNQPGQRFSSPRLILQFTEVVQWLFFCRENYTFQRIQRGANIFQWGPTFSRGGGGDPNANFYINLYNFEIFKGGPDPLYPTLDPHMGDTPEIMNL